MASEGERGAQEEHGQITSTTRNLPPFDTSLVAHQFGTVSSNTLRSPSSNEATPTVYPDSTRVLQPQSPLSLRTRDRALSLRRSLFSRTLSDHSHDSHSPLPDRNSRSITDPRRPYESDATRTSPKQTTPSVTISQAKENEGNIELGESSRVIHSSSSALPHYERLALTRAKRFSLYRKLRSIFDRARKTVLRIQEIPPSKDGRHIQLGTYGRKKPLDERTGRHYIDNSICSSRYTLWNFLPRQLLAQFSKLANFYFLCVAILQMIPGLSTTGNYTTIVPLTFFISISMAKEAYDDLRRYKLDKAENNQEATIFASKGFHQRDESDSDMSISTVRERKHWEKIKWKDVHVGDVIRLERDEAVPADLVLLSSKSADNTAYMETMALDGETNLKTKQVPSRIAERCRDAVDIARCSAHFVVEDPNLDLYKFEGKVQTADDTLPLSNNEVVYRGSILRNTSSAVGLVIYTGEECKIRMNATKNPRVKAPNLQANVNRVVIVIVIFVVLLAIFNTVAYQIWSESTEEKAWYLSNAGVAFVPILSSFIILFNTMIPLSLYVNLEIIKLCQLFLMKDVEMYDEASNTPMEPRTSTINEDLGQVNYIFSDKTGTLTNNTMKFRKLSVAGTSWLHDPEGHTNTSLQNASDVTRHQSSKGKRPLRTMTTDSPDGRKPGRASLEAPENGFITSPTSRANSFPFTRNTALRSDVLVDYVRSKPHSIFAKKARFFLLSLALCHTCLPEKIKDGTLDYQAASPDEQALVRGAQQLGYIVVDRQASTITINQFGRDLEYEAYDETYQILDVIEFSSDRKRMSVVIRMPDNRICIICKGADSVLSKRLRKADVATEKAMQVAQRVGKRQSLEAQEAIRRQSEQRERQDIHGRASLSLQRRSLGGLPRSSLSGKRLQPISDELDGWLRERETDVYYTNLDDETACYSPRRSDHFAMHQSMSPNGRSSFGFEQLEDLIEEAMVADDEAVFERTFQHISDFATDGLRTLLYAYRFLPESEYTSWHKIYLEASTSLENRQSLVEKAGELIERDFELAGATAIEDKLQDGVPEAIEKLRRAKIKLWMLTGDKRETAINIGKSCHLIKDYSSVTILDHQYGDVEQSIAAAGLDIESGRVAHSVIVIDGDTLSRVEADPLVRKLFIELAILVDSVICCRASPSQKAFLVGAIRRKVKNATTLAIGDGANDIAMIQEAHVGIGITGKEGLQAARTSDYSIAQFKFLLRLLLVHGRWNYIRTCIYTLGTFWKEMLFYLTQALYQRYAGYTGTSLYESWSLSMFNTLFTSLPVIFVGIFEKDLSANTLLAVPELYSYGQQRRGFNVIVYLQWMFMASSEAVVVYFIMLGLYGQALFTSDNSLYAMGALTFSACVVIIATKMQFIEVHDKSYTCAIAILGSVGGWTLWNLILSGTYTNNTVYDVKDGLLKRFGRNCVWWLTLILIVIAVWAFEIAVRVFRCVIIDDDVAIFQELEKDPTIKQRFESAARVGIVSHPTFSSAESELGPRVPNEQSFKKDLQSPSHYGHTRKRTAEEEAARENEVVQLLNRPRVMFADTSHPSSESHSSHGVRRRQQSEPDAKAAAAAAVEIAEREIASPVDGRDETAEDSEGSTKGHSKGHKRRKSLRRSVDVQGMLKKGFGNMRRSLDV